MATKQWSELRPGVRRLVAVGAVAEAALKIAALVDLVRRPADQVRGSKSRWAAAIVVINSLGAVPIAYFKYGRRPPPPEPGVR